MKKAIRLVRRLLARMGWHRFNRWSDHPESRVLLRQYRENGTFRSPGEDY